MCGIWGHWEEYDRLEEEETVGNENEWGMLWQKMQVEGMLANRMNMKSWFGVAVGPSGLSPRDPKFLALHWQGTSALIKAVDAFQVPLPCSCGTASSVMQHLWSTALRLLCCVRVFSVSLGQISSAVCCWHVVRSVHNSNHGSRRENQVPFAGKALDGGDGNLILEVLSFHSRNFFG